MALADFAQVHPELELDVMVAEGEAMREAFDVGKLNLALADTLSIGVAPRRHRVPLGLGGRSDLRPNGP
jgi:hypothetical protein